MRLKFAITIYLNLFLQTFVFSQKDSDYEMFDDLFKVDVTKTNYKIYYKDNSNELKQISTSLFVIYKEFISSQDGNHCVFYPSCSVYTIQAIKNQGIIIGLINGVDRLSRCNALSPENYKKYKNSKLFFDPVE